MRKGYEKPKLRKVGQLKDITRGTITEFVPDGPDGPA
ncbi:MAG: lasso RiPP family leader peptide-containing protein [Armatimonadota bacterium]